MINKIFFRLLLSASLLVSFPALSANNNQYPNITGKALFELRTDRVVSNASSGNKRNYARVNVDSEFSLNFNKNWSVVTDWIFRPVMNRDANNPERYRNILTNRGITMNDEGLIVEQLKGQYQNEDVRAVFGKFNPEFGTAFSKEKRIGVFTTDFTKDYELREKLGGAVSALLNKSTISLSVFTNDTTGLNDSIINQRGAEHRGDGVAGNTSGPSSYAISTEGQGLFGVSDLFYNFGYRNLNVENIPGRDNETGYVGGLEYSFPVGLHASIIPFIEVARLNNMSGMIGRDATYTTVAVVGKYSGWTGSISNLSRQIRRNGVYGNVRDNQLQYSIGYKFTNNIALDVSRMGLKENNKNATLMGAVLSYLYVF